LFLPNKFTTFLLLFYFLWRWLSTAGQSPASVRVLDVGQGDAILIRSSQNKLILIDGGPDFEVDYYLQRENLFNRCEIELLVLTHPHADHLRGLNRLLKRCQVNSVAFNRIDYDSYGYAEWLNDTEEKTQLNYQLGDTIVVDELSFHIIWPPDGRHQEMNVNNSSLVLLLDSGEYEALFLGDLEITRLRFLDRSLLGNFIDGPLELYKAGHHGSKNAYDMSLLQFLKPRLCVISVGEDNKFGHPHMEALEAFEKVGCKVKRTDVDGSIEVLIN
jgi:competence protein ComEC